MKGIFDMSLPFNVDFILSNFSFGGEYEGYETKNDGHINSTYVLHFKCPDGKRLSYTVQKINTYVFKKPDELMANISGVTSYLKNVIVNCGGDPDRETLNYLKTTDGRDYCVDDEGGCWRAYNYVDGVYTCNTIDSAQVFCNAGKAFGKFQNQLADYPIETLYDTIPNFHNTYSRFNDFKKAVSDNLSGRAENVKEEIDFVLRREEDTKVLLNLCDEGKLPVRVTHNDTKLNNILFDSETDEGICIIDLDTVMPGLSLYDFGDSIRFGANTASEDEKDVSKVSLDLELYKAYVEGYLSSAKDSLNEYEIEYLPFSAKLMTLECGMRFLADYLNGDVYFKTEYPEHNLVRCRTQFKLVEDIEKKMDKMKKITADAAKR